MSSDDECVNAVPMSKAAQKKIAKKEFRKEHGKKRERATTAATEKNGGSASVESMEGRSVGEGHGRHAELLSSSGAVPTYTEMLAMTPQLTTSGKETNKLEGTSNADVDAFINGLNGQKVGSLEIYARFPLAYDILMGFHDCSDVTRAIWGILSANCTLQLCSEKASTTSPRNLSLLDIGCGTGRLSRLLVNEHMKRKCPGGITVIGYDKYPHMLRVFHDRLTSDSRWEQHPTANTMMAVSNTTTSNNANKVCLRPISFEQIGLPGTLGEEHPKVDAVMVGWCLSYVMRSSWSDEVLWKSNVSAILTNIIANCCRKSSSDSSSASDYNSMPPSYIFVLETLGVGVTPSRNSPLVTYLTEQWGFEPFNRIEGGITKGGADIDDASKSFIRTDYHFPSKDVAKALSKFFFAGSRVPALLEESSAAGTILPECTGMWVKRV